VLAQRGDLVALVRHEDERSWKKVNQLTFARVIESGEQFIEQ